MALTAIAQVSSNRLVAISSDEYRLVMQVRARQADPRQRLNRAMQGCSDTNAMNAASAVLENAARKTNSAPVIIRQPAIRTSQ